MKIKNEDIKKIYEKMLLIRKAEEAFQREFYAGNVPGFIHLYLGEEAIASAVSVHLKKDDCVTSTHRGHGHFIAKGSDLNKIAAEIMGKSTGLCQGRGGSMHMTDMDNGMFGTTGIVGGGFPIAVGLAFAFKKLKRKQVSVCFFGDGSVNEGTFHESVNLAAIWDLPVVFVCENNMYAQSTPQEYHQKVKNISERAKGYGITGETVDGMNACEVYEAAQIAIEKARRGEGPTLLECKTYLYSGHYVGDAKKYRDSEEMRFYEEEKDCIKLLRSKMIKSRIVSAEELENIEKEVEDRVKTAIEFAGSSQFPESSEVRQNVYYDYPESVLWR